MEEVDFLEHGDFSKDYSVAITRQGSVITKKLSNDKDSTPTNTWKLDQINPAWMVKCWKDSNKCVFTGHYRSAVWYVGDNESETQQFRYNDKNSSQSNAFKAVVVIEGTDYFLAGDSQALSVTRWLATDGSEVAEYQVGGSDETKECEELKHIKGTKLLVLSYDEMNPIPLIDITTMTKIREIIHPSITYDESKCEYIDFWTDKFRLVCL